MPCLTPMQFASRIAILRPKLQGYARSSLKLYTRGHVSQDDVEDAVGDTLARALKHLPTYDDHWGDTGLSKWLYVILRQVCFQQAQKDGIRAGTRPLDDTLPDPANLEVTVITRLALSQTLQRAPLAPRERQCLQGRIRGESSRETALRLSITVRSVDGHVSRARCKMRIKLDAD